MKRNIIILLTAFFIVGFLFSQGMGRSKKIKTNVEKFSLIPFAEPADSDSIKIVTFIEIPFYSLQFVKDGNEFVAVYKASIGIKGKKGKSLGHHIWTDSIRVTDYTHTKSKIKNRKHFFTFIIPTGEKYELIGELQDADTRKKGIQKKKINLEAYLSTPSLMTPLFFLNLDGKWGFKDGMIPTKGYRVREIGDGIQLQISGFVGPGDFNVEVYLSNGNITDSLINQFNGYGDLGYFKEIIFIPALNLESIKNDFEIIITQNRKKDKKQIVFSTYKSGISNFVNNIDMALKQMKYIISNDERLKLKGQSSKDKEQIFYTLWKDRDPTPKTEYNELMEEYYGRVWYANEHFDAWQPGWETDRGMIYILFGAPDEVQRTNPSTSSSSLYQVWSYYKVSKQFVFKDQNGFGDFRLETPFLGVGL
ncbi:MAG: GWxTD domain-containing protein [Candidatus Marinimicrobia bacterium]|jgi:GWxTD domain-containing protein|nr:GWxTD domain-containing protein [Candidatus Neomarinimicrobiota bacterium]MBT3502326.1 GWxTD domain-containing protein [Candidatus Neomarinimicrobiota bacterium]MBT3840392.1 GWxTD domain-containing protein [Candidatus Neomarinimicrobiota bacterium]MBT3999457.1 GWxTD domain-containing protein [Candidatus Neomarinimicrobiota bacterium]MBT4282050.1 GWxTD domain-containing protein [Candidatus Neomarinimicrobiota bacterium]